MLSKTAIRRLKSAIAFMRTVPREHFGMSAWVLHEGGLGFAEHGIKDGHIFKEKDLRTCGTTACAAGWLATTPAWRRAGITLTTDGGWDGSLNSYRAVREYLDIDEFQFSALFLGPAMYVSTPKQWARMAERLIKKWKWNASGH